MIFKFTLAREKYLKINIKIEIYLLISKIYLIIVI